MIDMIDLERYLERDIERERYVRRFKRSTSHLETIP